MKKRSFLVMLAFVACKSSSSEIPAPPVPVAAGGAPSAMVASAPRPAVDAFLSAVRSQDLQAVSANWGCKQGPVQQCMNTSREDLEQRTLVLIRCLRHDKARLVGEQPAADNERVVQAELTLGTQTRIVDFFTAKASDRWYVRYAQPLCPTSK